MIIWVSKYSDTNESDERGRWSRIACFNLKGGLFNDYKYELGYVNRIDIKGIIKYSLSVYFPAPYKNAYHKLFDTYEECQQELQNLFLEFINDIKQ